MLALVNLNISPYQSLNLPYTKLNDYIPESLPILSGSL